MPVNLGNPLWVTFIADANTPTALLKYHQMPVPLPAGTVLPTGLDYVAISGVKVWGYARAGTSGPEWVMQPEISPIQLAVNAIPGGTGWTSLTARQTYYDIGLALLAAGVPGPALAPGLKQLHDAAIANYFAAHP